SDLCNSGCEVHDDGEIWATVLEAMRRRLEMKYGTSTGLRKDEQLIFDGMKATITTPTFLDGRDGVLAADTTDNGGANQCLIWDVFATRGMGFSALGGDSQ